MAGASSREVLEHLNTLFHCGAAGQLSDAELLERFVAGRDEAAEAAFAASGRAAWGDGPGCLPARAGKPRRGRRRLSGHVSGAGEEGFGDRAAGTTGELAAWRRPPGRARCSGPRDPPESEGKTVGCDATRRTTRPDHGERATRHSGRRARSPARTPSGRHFALRAGRAVSPGCRHSARHFRRYPFEPALPGQVAAAGPPDAAGLCPVGGRAGHCPDRRRPRGHVTPCLLDSTIRVATLVAAGSSLAGVVSTSVAP